MIRILKIGLISIVALQALIFATQNIVNLEACYGAVAYTLGMTGHDAYPGSLGPPIESAGLIWIAVIVIIAAEISVGVVTGAGVWQLWNARGGTGTEFNAAKGTAIVGCGMAMLVWFGLFGMLGGAYFQMWQTTAGALSLEGAFQYAGSSALIALYVGVAESP